MGANPVIDELAPLMLRNLSRTVEATLALEAIRLALTVTTPPKGYEDTPGMWWDERGQDIVARIVKLVREVGDG